MRTIAIRMCVVVQPNAFVVKPASEETRLKGRLMEGSDSCYCVAYPGIIPL